MVPLNHPGIGVTKLSALLPLVLVYAVFVIFNYDFIEPLLENWWSSHESSQGLVILPVSVWLVVQQLLARPTLTLQPAWVLVLLFVAVSSVIHVSSIMHIQVVEFSALVVAFTVIPVALFGVRRPEVAADSESYFPALYSLMALPLWDYLNPVFRLISLKATEQFLRLSPIPSYVEGYRIELASGVFVVDDGCSGLRFMVSALAISLLYAYLYFRTKRARALCVASLLALALVGNWVRIIVIVIIGYITDMKSPLVNDHATFGWVIFAVLLVVWMFWMNRLERES
ncbi:MAG: exosortase [Immundisolibacteraceae bacterium]|nr:exosortase [Immundisolibacteraceae bacterium]